MNRFNQPKSFELAGMTVKVKKSTDLKDSCGALGIAQYDLCQIQTDTEGYPEDTKAITFYHELTHFILHVMGYEDLRSNEAFVDTFANHLWQFIKTAK